MYCPICGQQQVSEITRFCSRCGFLLTGIAQVVANNGNVPFAQPESNFKLISPRKRGLKQGLFIFLLGNFLLVPIAAILTAAFNLESFLIPILAIISFVGGILRMIYALMFEDGGQPTVPNQLLPEAATGFLSSFGRSSEQKVLPPPTANFNQINSVYAPPVSQPIPARNQSWHQSNTNELEMPPSVTEDTTKLLGQQNQQ